MQLGTKAAWVLVERVLLGSSRMQVVWQLDLQVYYYEELYQVYTTIIRTCNYHAGSTLLVCLVCLV